MTINERAPEGDRSLAAVEPRLGMPLVEAMETQRAVRRVLPDPVDPEIVLRCIELALKAPTGSNGQNWEFVVVKERATKALLAARYREAWRLYGGIGHWVAREQANGGLAGRVAKAMGSSGSADPESMAKILRAVQWQVDHFEDLPVLVIPCLRG